MFLPGAQRPKSHRDHHAIHHNFTTKTPRENITFPTTPFKKHHKTTKIPLSCHQKKFLKKTGLGYLNGLEEQTGRRHS
jgi:hypothetical protein